MSRIEELEKRLAADPNSRIFVQLAEEYRKQGLLDNAIEVCEQGISKHPEYPSARVALGRALLEAEDFDRAREQFETVLTKVPDNILANKFLGETYHRLGRLEDAIGKFEVAKALAPEDADLDEKIATVLGESQSGPPKLQAEETPRHADVAAPKREENLAAPGVVESAPSAPSMDEPAPAASADAEDLTFMADASAAVLPEEPEPASVGAEPFEPLEELTEDPVRPAEPLAPIPLVEVDEPMVLEDRAYTPPAESFPSHATPETAPPSDEMELEDPATAYEPPPPTPSQAPEPLPAARLFDEPRRASASETPPAIAEQSEGGDSEIDTPTMAELYAAQGHYGKAIAVYRRLLALDPNSTQYLGRMEELERLSTGTGGAVASTPPSGVALSDGGRERMVEVLEGWLDAIRRSRRA